MRYYKNRNREKPVFSNINLQGPCNYKCYFCLGNDLCLSNKINYLTTHFNKWKNFDSFLALCRKDNIDKLYLTGQNTDPLLYFYLDELIDYLKKEGFKVGIRTNGFLSLEKMAVINSINSSISLSIHSLSPNIHKKITGVNTIAYWDKIINKIKVPLRVSIVVNRYNENEIFDIIKFLSNYDNVRYIQLRCVCTDTRYNTLKDDMASFDRIENTIDKRFPIVREFYTSKIYNIYGMEVSIWKTVQTTINSYNYFTEGIISDDYFVIEGYNKYKI